MTRFPLICNFNDPVIGKGFIAGVAIRGRALLTEEDGAWWMYGVNPGGIAADGGRKEDAMNNFRATWKAVLHEIAEDSATFSDFKKAVELFFQESSDEHNWDEAVAEVRRHSLTVEWVPTESADQVFGIHVVKLTQRKLKPEANANPLDQGLAIAA